MISSISSLCVIGVVLVLQNAAPSAFVGTWTGYQSWAIEDAPPGREPQPVTLTIELVDGKLVGVMTPFFGGTDSAYFTATEITGDQLRASAAVGTPGGQSRGFTANVKVEFDFKSGDRNNLTGTAEVRTGDVKWIKFKYELGRQRSRY